MRLLIMVPFAAVAACGGEAEKKVETRAAHIDSGQWETGFEVTTFTTRDAGPPKINSPVGTRSSGVTCVTAENATRPPPTIFVGAPFECEYQDFYMRNGRINLLMQCRHPDFGERVGVTAVGDFTATGYQATVQYTTREAGPGDVVVVTRATGRRTGAACTAPPVPAGNEAAPL